MKFNTTLSLIFVFSQSARADQKNVNVQCDIVGPIYSGTLEFEQDISKWNPASECQPIRDDHIYFHQTLYLPSFILKFNQLTYRSKSSDKILFEQIRNCDWSLYKGKLFRFYVFEQSSGANLLSTWKWTEPGKLPNEFELSYFDQGCTVKILP